ncbi:MAG: hypothetical protein ACUVX8_02260 [Candidatus Zipacnadales bacterium]
MFVAVLAVLLAGCGGNDGGPADQGQAIPLQTTFSTAPFTVDRVTLTSAAIGERLITDTPTARIERPDGSSSPVEVVVDSRTGALTVGRVDLVASPGVEETHEAPSQADVRVLATVMRGGPGEIAGVSVKTIDVGDKFDISNAEAHVHCADGTSQKVQLDINATGTEVTLGAFTVTPPKPNTSRYWRLNTVTIDGPIFVRDGATGSTTQIGELLFSFGMEADGDIIAPESIQASIPTIGAPNDPRVIVDGLRPYRDYVWIAVTEQTGAQNYSATHMADENGRAIIPDTGELIAAERLSGPNSVLEMCFASTWRWVYEPVTPPYRADGPIPNWAALNMLVLNGPFRITSSVTGRTVEFTRLRLGFHVMADGSVIAPQRIDWALPANDVALNRPVRIIGLQAGDMAQLRVITSTGRESLSHAVSADRSGMARLQDGFSNFTATDFSGSGTTIAFFFARPPT